LKPFALAIDGAATATATSVAMAIITDFIEFSFLFGFDTESSDRNALPPEPKAQHF
jgi:hypothetical protein